MPDIRYTVKYMLVMTPYPHIPKDHYSYHRCWTKDDYHTATETAIHLPPQWITQPCHTPHGLV